jgi:LPS O-antigen subunit length determinant protein (WzzB/FepE family)
MELKDQILQTKERKKGFLKAMPETTRTQVDTYTKLDKISGSYWIVIVCGAVLALIGYLIACLADPETKWVLNLIPAALLIGCSVIAALYVKSLTKKAKKAITLGAPDYVEELNAINARLSGLEKAEKARIEAEKQEARAKARAEAAQREAELAMQKQQEAMQSGAKAVQGVEKTEE